MHPLSTRNGAIYVFAEMFRGSVEKHLPTFECVWVWYLSATDAGLKAAVALQAIALNSNYEQNV